VGISGIDGPTIKCRLVPELGAVGEPDEVDPTLLWLLMGQGMVPVLSPVAMGPDGSAVNVNADEVACAVAIAVKADRLLLLSDVPAVQVAGAAQQEIAADQVESLIKSGDITGGMVPKLRAAADAVRKGVTEVRISGFEPDLSRLGGTCVRAGEVQGG
jgi:acetylglutamate kinase